jgi:exopolyphosphatase/guanosine-5'-triphosphate,3'-diphosphate pyrophosphatase
MNSDPFASIDMGTNATRVAIGVIDSEEGLKIIHTNRYPLRLGTGVFCNGNITSEIIDESASIFSNIKKIFDSKRVGTIRAVATSALREARNSHALVERIKRDTGIRIEVISGIEEASLVSWAISTKLQLDGFEHAIADLGAGSLELIKVVEQKPVWMHSYTLGTVRFAGMDANILEKTIPELLEKTIQKIDDRFKNTKKLVATGGNIETISGLIESGFDENRNKIINIWNLEVFINQCKKMTIEEIRYYFGLSQERAEVICPAAIVNLWLANKLKVDCITVPMLGLREALLMDIAQSIDPTVPFSSL